MVIRTLWDRFRECRSQGLPGIPRDELLRYMAQAAKAIDVLNQEQDTQYLDVKPQNLVLLQDQVTLSNSGLCKGLQGMVSTVTPPGITPVYRLPRLSMVWSADSVTSTAWPSSTRKCSRGNVLSLAPTCTSWSCST
jgi:eukaryotic-like serine/threonine-protein kinase